jgi:PAS domain S-box-containing protein
VSRLQPISTDAALRAENEQLRTRLEEAEEMLRAIRGGEVDALVVEGDAGPRLFTLQGLDAEQNRLRSEMLAQVSDAVIAVDLEERITYLNAAAERQYGVRADEVLGRKQGEIFARHWPSPEQEAAASAALRTQGEWFGEYLQRTPDGRELYVDSSTTTLRNSNGEAIGHLTAIRDITERKQAEEATARLAALVESSDDALFGQDLDGIITSWNRGAEALFGYRADEIVGTSIMRLIPESAQAQEREVQRKIAAGERVGNVETVRQRKDGRSFPVSLTVSPLRDAAGNLIGASKVVRDITAEIQAEMNARAGEQRMQLAIEATQVGIWEWNVRTNQIRWNAQLFRLYGIAPTSGGMVDYTDWSGAVLPEDLAENEAILQDTVRRGGQSTRHFRIRRRNDGQIRDVVAVETVRTDAQGQTEWVVGTNLDITERKRTEEELRRLAAQLSEADRRKDAFLATLSHELRNPLASIRNDLHLMGRARDDRAAIEQSRARMERQLALLVRLIDDLMDLSRISQDKIVLKSERLELANVLRSTLDSNRAVLEPGGHPVTVTLPPQPIGIVGDAARLIQVFSNLLTNAAKYSDRGDPISITVEPQSHFAEVHVRDRGIGIASSDLPRLFEMFAQVESSRHKAQGGLGIGLHLVKRLVTMHGGSIEVRSEGLGQGSEFIVRLPLLASADPEVQPPAEEVEPIGKAAQRRILVADDNRDSADSLAMLLSIMGNDVRTTYDGEGAVDLAASFRPEVILLDIGMPILNGYDACRRIREQAWSEKAVLIALTGWGQEEDRRRSHEAGFNHHMVKPLEPTALMQLLESLPSVPEGQPIKH